MMRARFLICSLALGLALALAGCPPSLDLGTEPGPDTEAGDTDILVIPDGVGEACKEAPLPDCKLDGVCGAMNASKFHLVYRCNDDTGEWSCDYDALEGYEKKEVSCDGLDNDCDGTKDEADHVVFEDACPDMNTGVCAADPGSVVMGCVSSGSPVQYRWVCDAAAVNGWAATERFDPQAEEPGLLCDGEDNDCDGDVDEDHASDAGLSVEEVAALPFYKCQPFQGLCAGQIVNDDPYEVSGDVVFRCNGGVLECSYGLIPEFSAPEKACDGLDNDCDGETDEVTDIDLSTCPHSGVCEGKVSALCVDGQWLCHMLEALADPLYQVEESRCDGLDNDCDGETDEGLDWLSLLEARGCPGDCADPICKAWHPDCEGPGTLTFTKDNRCPRTHKNTALPGNPWVPDEDAQGRPVLPGVCQHSPETGWTDVLMHCLPWDGNGDGTQDGAFFTCRYDALAGVYAADESQFPATGSWCDNLDNDCDGVVDGHRVNADTVSWIEVTPLAPQHLPDTSCRVLGECATGTSALCAGGQWECSYEGAAIEPGTAGACAQGVDASGCIWTETSCDAKDNDCDGETDEGIVSSAVAALDAAACAQEGVCAGVVQAVCNPKGTSPGTWTCDYANAFLLGYETLEDGDPVLCDGLDNDCDGLTDEEISAGPTDADYDLILEAAGCLHQGVCQDQVHAACNPDASGPADRWDCDYGVVEDFGGVVLNGTLWENLCDGLDNDCDGATDENLGQDFGGAQSPKVLSGCRFSGICQGTMLWGCAAGKWTCQGPTAMGWEVTEASCDGVDNDCDGLTDQGLSNPSSCPGFGKGVCTAGISAPCQNAQWACSYAAVTGYEAVEATCDGKDNDCDNATDEGLAWTTSPGNNACKSKGVCHPEDVVAVCTGTVSGWTCNYDAVDDYTPSEGLGFCDGLDNDCDGTKDEQACGPCMGCTGNADCYSGLCYPDPFGSRRFCSTATKSCVQEDPATGQCKSVADSQVACISEAGRAICVSGQWNDPSVSDCSGATPVCYGGVCKKCLPQALACNGNQVLQCDGNGNNLYPIDTCAAGKICVGAGQCITNNEFQVDVLTAGALTFAPKPRVAALKGGGFVVAWGSANPTADGSGSAVQARLFNAAFQPAGQPFLVNDNLDNDQSLPSVAAFPTGFGRFVVAWTTVDSPGDSGQGVVARIFEKDGTPVTDEIPVNQTKALDQANPSVTLFADGSFLVAWDTKLQDNTYDVDARYFLADGTPDGDEFTLTTFQDFNQRTPDLASLPDGGVAASWTSTGKDSQGFAVAALTLSPTGLVDLGELLVNDYEFGSQKNQVVVSLAGDKAGWFGVVWESQKQAVGDSSGIYLELFDPDGIEVGAAADLLVHQNDLGAQAMPRAARLGDSDLVVVWQSDAVDGNGVGVARRIMGITGAPKTAELVVNQSVTGNQEDPDVDALDRAAFVVVWTNANNGHVMGRILNN